MKDGELKITFQPAGRSVFVLPHTSLVEAAGLAGIILQTPCGGKGTCGKCRVRVLSGRTSAAGQAAGGPLTERQLGDGYRLACRASAETPLVVEVPEESTFGAHLQILVGDTGEKGNLNPAVHKVHFRLPPPTSEDVRPDLARLRDAVGDVAVPADLLTEIPAFLRAHGWQGTAVIASGELAGLEPGDTVQETYGLGVDVGTTTVVGTLFRLADGAERGLASRMNSQIAFGDDVISRILRIRENAGALPELQHAILQTINDIIRAVCQQSGIPPERIYEVCVAGNSTMQQILCGFDPSALGEVPFVQVFDRAQTLSASRLGILANARAPLYVFPQIGGFVGGDTVAGMVAARLDRCERPVLLVDIGTNGEIVLSHGGDMLAASTAAGPAFEGARIRQGMRATVGAIEKVIIGEDVHINVIGNARPSGLCGTALIDAAAGMLRAGILDSTGRIVLPEEAPPGLAPALRARLQKDDGHARFVLVEADETATGEPICLWQRDIRELQLATAAIRAGIHLLLRRAGLSAADLGAVLLAGAFGNFIRRSEARRIGLLPQIPCDRIRFIGNAASLGAKLVLLSQEERRYAAEIREKTRHVDLSGDAEFQAEFAEAMIFPEADLDACSDH
jgi:uncharacterized 2Fe-2S/4Fe-4S cluster protein (DUF4445 family)